MIAQIRHSLSLDGSCVLVNPRGLRVVVAIIGICDLGIWDAGGQYWSLCRLDIGRFSVEK